MRAFLFTGIYVTCGTQYDIPNRYSILEIWHLGCLGVTIYKYDKYRHFVWRSWYFYISLEMISSEHSSEINRILSKLLCGTCDQFKAYFRGNSRSLCSRFRKCLLFPFGFLIPFTVTSPTKRLKWRRNPQGLASCGRNERTEGLSPLNSPLNDSHKYGGWTGIRFPAGRRLWTFRK